MKQCPFCAKTYPDSHRVSDMKQHQNLCVLNPDRTIRPKRKLKSNGWSGRKHSEESKRKISESRRNFLIANPDQVPYLLNHYSKGESYPEQYFRSVLENENIAFVREFRISIYRLDFAILEKKLAIEIDGEQHYTDMRICRSNALRDKFLDDLGWTTIRIRWSHFKKLSEKEQKDYIFSLIDKISKHT